MAGLAVVAPATVAVQNAQKCNASNSFIDKTWTYSKRIPGSDTGSADGGSAGSQISSDPSGFIADIINQIELGKLLGLAS